MSFLDDLLSNPSGASFSTEQSPQGAMLQQLIGSPQQVQTQPPEQAVQQPAGVVNPDPMVVTGDSFKPTHRNWFGRLADALAGKPIYENRMRERDLTNAMQGFQDDPLRSIARIAKIPGMADDAYKMYEQYGTDQERNESRNIRDAAKMDMMWTRLGSMAGASNEKNYPAMHEQMLRYIDTWGLPDAQTQKFKEAIPDTWDPDRLASLTEGAIKPGDQQKIAIQQQGADTRANAATNLQRYRVERLKQMGQAETDKNTRFQQSQAARPKAQSVMTKYGPGIIGKSGNTMIVVRGGKHYGYMKSGVNHDGSINWTPAGEVNIK
jgi:hypothetical protein